LFTDNSDDVKINSLSAKVVHARHEADVA